MKSSLLIAAAVLVIATSARAEQPTQGESQFNQAMIQAQKKNIIAQNMNLDDKTAPVFWSLYSDYQVALQEVVNRSIKMLQGYSLNWQQLSDDQAADLLNQFMDIQTEKLKIQKKFIAKFRKSLPPKTVSRYFQIENKLDANANYEMASKVPLVH